MLLRQYATLLRAVVSCICLTLLSRSAAAQDDHHNIIIDRASTEVAFVPAKGRNGAVLVKEKSTTSYLCQDYRTTLPVAAFYDDQTRIDEVKVYLNGDRNRSIQPRHEYYHQDDIFYSDARVCHLVLPFEKKGATAEVAFEKTVLNPLYFTTIYFAESHRIREKTITLAVPDWMTVDVKEFNFEGWDITRTKESKSRETVYTYVLRDARALKKETNAPGPSHFMPHILVMSKESRLDGITRTYFKTLGDQYQWYHGLVADIGNDEAVIGAKAQEITAGETTDSGKVKAIYYWVQQHIRYIAYENGIAGYKPEKAQEVLRKKYGDCKGMGNLMAVMLRSLGFDARLCWLGTRHIAYDYSTPSLGVDNHMIAAWMHKGKPVFLDGTEKFLGFGETAERIQGRPVLIENGDDYLLQTIPVAPHAQNTSTEQRLLRIDGQDLKGTVKHVYKGENKEAILQVLDGVGTDRRDEVLRRYLSGGSAAYEISNLRTSDLGNYHGDLVIEYDLVHKAAVTSFGAEHYLDLDNRKQFADYGVDTAKHQLPYMFPFKDHQVLDVRITLPSGARAKSLPAPVALSKPAYGFRGQWNLTDTELSYRAETWMEDTFFPVRQLPVLNQDLQQLKSFYNAQPELSL